MEFSLETFNNFHNTIFKVFESRLNQKGAQIPKTQNQRYGRGQFDPKLDNLVKDICEKINESEANTIYLGDRLYRMFYEINKPRTAKIDEEDLKLLLKYVDCESWTDFEQKYLQNKQNSVHSYDEREIKLVYYQAYFTQKGKISIGYISFNFKTQEIDLQGDMHYPNIQWRVNWHLANTNLFVELEPYTALPNILKHKLYAVIHIGANFQKADVMIGTYCSLGDEIAPIAGEIVLVRVNSREEAEQNLLAPVEPAIIMHLQNKEIRLQAGNYLTIKSLPSYEQQMVLAKFAGNYETYFLEMTQYRITKLATTIQENGQIQIQEGFNNGYSGNIQVMLGGVMLRAKVIPAMEKDPLNHFDFILYSEKSGLFGVYSGVGVLRMPRAGRLLLLRTEQKYDEIASEEFEIGSEKCMQLFEKFPRVRAFFAGERHDNYVDSAHLLSNEHAITNFYAACFLAEKQPIEALNKLKSAFLMGFKHKILLIKELAEGGALYSLREYIDAEKCKLIGEDVYF